MKKIHRFIGPFDISADRLLIRDPELVHQFRRVLKLAEGESVCLADGAGREALARISSSAKEGIEMAIEERGESADPARRVTLYSALLKSDHFEFVAQKATETGAHKIVPVIAARTVKTGMKLDRLRKIAKEAAEQCGRGRIPEIADPVPLAAAIRAAAEEAQYFFDPSGSEFSAPDPSSVSAGIWVGPEGGWEDGEIRLAEQKKMAISSLGRLVLRAETAAAIAVYLASR